MSSGQHRAVYGHRQHALNLHCRSSGLLGLFKGLSPYLVRVMPATCVTFLVYENVNSWVKEVL